MADFRVRPELTAARRLRGIARCVAGPQYSGAVCSDAKAPTPQTLRTVGCASSVTWHGRATAEGTAEFVKAKPLGRAPGILGRSGLQISPVGFGCHRLENLEDQRAALEVAIRLGCNFIDVAPNYSDSGAERAAGEVMQKLFASGAVRREELVVATKVGNVVGSALKSETVRTCEAVARVREDVWHCIAPAWIEEELSRSLERLGISCVDVVLLHCPEFASRAAGVDMEEVYRRIGHAFVHLEGEVARGRVARYGVTAAFYPLRPSEPEHLLLDRLLDLLPSGHHFEVIQFPLNFAEPQALWAGHTARRGDGAAVDRDLGVAAPPLVALARRHGLATLANRPLDGIYGERRGVLRFASEVPLNSEMQDEDIDALEEKLTLLCAPSLGDADEPVTEELAAKTVKVLASLADVDCVLVGMRRVDYVVSVARMLHTTPPLGASVALDAVRRAHDTLTMWFCVGDDEDDHGTAKQWRLPARQ